MTSTTQERAPKGAVQLPKVIAGLMRRRAGGGAQPGGSTTSETGDYLAVLDAIHRPAATPRRS